MLSITDLLDFIDLDRETVQVVNRATRLPDEEAAAMAAELLRTQCSQLNATPLVNLRRPR